MMKSALTKLFSPILSIFESGSGEYSYKPSHRNILKIVGSLFLILSIVSALATLAADQMGGAIPVLFFFVVAFVCLLVGFLGSDRAVAKIWGSR